MTLLETAPVHAPTLEEQIQKSIALLNRKDKYVVYVGRTGERIDGYAIVDDEKG